MGLGVALAVALGAGGVPGPAPFSPKSVGGLTAWFDASQITGVADGAPLASWTDLSGNGYNATQSNASARPTYYSSTSGKTVNGLPAVWWTGADDMQTAQFAASLAAGTVFCVTEIPTTNFIAALDGIANGAEWKLGTLGQSGSGYVFGIYQGGNVQGTAVNDGAIHQLTGIYAGSASSALRLDGAQVASGNAGSLPLTGLTLGALYTGSNGLNPDFLCEVLLYGSVLTAAQIAAVEAYLKSKWGTP